MASPAPPPVPAPDEADPTKAAAAKELTKEQQAAAEKRKQQEEKELQTLLATMRTSLGNKEAKPVKDLKEDELKAELKTTAPAYFAKKDADNKKISIKTDENGGLIINFNTEKNKEPSNADLDAAAERLYQQALVLKAQGKDPTVTIHGATGDNMKIAQKLRDKIDTRFKEGKIAIPPIAILEGKPPTSSPLPRTPPAAQTPAPSPNGSGQRPAQTDEEQNNNNQAPSANGPGRAGRA